MSGVMPMTQAVKRKAEEGVPAINVPMLRTVLVIFRAKPVLELKTVLKMIPMLSPEETMHTVIAAPYKHSNPGTAVEKGTYQH